MLYIVNILNRVISGEAKEENLIANSYHRVEAQLMQKLLKSLKRNWQIRKENFKIEEQLKRTKHLKWKKWKSILEQV